MGNRPSTHFSSVKTLPRCRLGTLRAETKKRQSTPEVDKDHVTLVRMRSASLISGAHELAMSGGGADVGGGVDGEGSS